MIVEKFVIKKISCSGNVNAQRSRQCCLITPTTCPPAAVIETLFYRPRGVVDIAFDFGSKGRRFESCRGHFWGCIQCTGPLHPTRCSTPTGPSRGTYPSAQPATNGCIMAGLITPAGSTHGRPCTHPAWWWFDRGSRLAHSCRAPSVPHCCSTPMLTAGQPPGPGATPLSLQLPAVTHQAINMPNHKKLLVIFMLDAACCYILLCARTFTGHNIRSQHGLAPGGVVVWLSSDETA
jgi:hypothetical protein